MKRGVVGKLLPFLRPYRLRFLWALSQVFLIAGFELLKPWPMQIVIDNVLGGKPVTFGPLLVTADEYDAGPEWEPRRELADFVGEGQRSTSPITVSSEPTIAIMSAISASVMHVAVASSATNDGARNLTRHGFGPPSETT